MFRWISRMRRWLSSPKCGAFAAFLRSTATSVFTASPTAAPSTSCRLKLHTEPRRCESFRRENNRPHLAPIDSLSGSDCLLGGSETLGQRRPIEELHEVAEGFQPLGRQLIDCLLDFPTQLGGAHEFIVSTL